MSLKLRLIYTFVIVVLITTISMGLLSFYQARSVMLDRTTNTELPAQITQIKNEVENQIETLAINAEMLANNPMILEWAKNGYSESGEKNIVGLLSNIKEQLGLDTASWADRKTAKYWNQDGFLRTLTPEGDGWFFQFTDSSNSKNVSVYRSKSSGEVKLFVNYQNTNGRGLAGFGMNLDKMTNYLNNFTFNGGGFVYLVSQDGILKVHRNDKLLEKTTVTDLYGESVGQTLLKQDGLNIVMSENSVLASQYIPAMGWILVAEIPNEAVFGGVSSMGRSLLLMGVLLSIITVIVAFLIGSTLVKQLEIVAHNLKEIGEGEGDLSHRLRDDGPIELASIGNGFNKFVSVIHNMVKQVSQTSNQLNDASEQMLNSADTMLKDARLQSERTAMVASAIHEVEASVREVSGNAAQAADTANVVEREVSSGLNVVSSAKKTVENLAKESEKTATIVGELAKNSEQIGGILEVIRNISEQTNLLALNAAIESARAGEQGRGFAVVADEVRNLAKRTAQSTDEIQEMINQLQSESRKALIASKSGQEIANDGVESMQIAEQSLNSIAQQVNTMNKINQQVALATEQQLLAIEDVAQNVTGIQNSVETSVTTANSLSDNSKALRTLSSTLDTLVAGFKV
ncbi:methyl-accepting chemotaxis protein [Marinomonas profundimaris]|uniref:Methyl-accepting chemotaxis protein n=1 Tax=Marinomonas profundimaris TaxID=1208321 RepID=W1S2T3_9GAMM|nr:methyl-accepting chemotaxis protein [Marinomonas profundimaris]ETI62294.1 methyl-accepting chemotaxis protein [Marinomonas profundimaris]